MDAPMDALYDVMNDSALNFTFNLEAGQIQYLNNWHCVHQRAADEDYDDPERRRHLARIFMRDEGARSYMG